MKFFTIAALVALALISEARTHDYRGQTITIFHNSALDKSRGHESRMEINNHDRFTGIRNHDGSRHESREINNHDGSRHESRGTNNHDGGKHESRMEINNHDGERHQLRTVDHNDDSTDLYD